MHVEKVGSVMAASGIGRWPAHLLTKALERTEQVVREADLVLFLVDARDGVTPVDIQFARWVNKQSRPAILLANKAEGNIEPLDADDVRRMGMGEPLYCSVSQNEGIAQLITLLLPLATHFQVRHSKRARLSGGKVPSRAPAHSGRGLRMGMFVWSGGRCHREHELTCPPIYAHISPLTKRTFPPITSFPSPCSSPIPDALPFPFFPAQDPSAIGSASSPEKCPRVIILGRPNVGESALADVVLLPVCVYTRASHTT
jgi:predicted GTPase